MKVICNQRNENIVLFVWLQIIKESFVFSGNLNRTVTKFETEFKSSEFERLNMSSTVSSLEVAQMNMSRSQCGKLRLNLGLFMHF